MPIRSPRRAATRHASSPGASIVFSEGERKPETASGVSPRFASTREQRASTPAFCASSETMSASGSRSLHLAKPFLPTNDLLAFYTTNREWPSSLGLLERYLSSSEEDRLLE